MSLEDLKHDWRSEMDRSLPPAEIDRLLGVVQEHMPFWSVRCTIATFARSLPPCSSSFCSPVLVAGLSAVARGVSRRRAHHLRSSVHRLCFSDLAQAGTCIVPHRSARMRRNRRAWLDGQISLLRSVVWWYVGPIGVGLLLFHWGLAKRFPDRLQRAGRDRPCRVYGVVLLNRWSVREALLPVRETRSRTDRKPGTGEPGMRSPRKRSRPEATGSGNTAPSYECWRNRLRPAILSFRWCAEHVSGFREGESRRRSKSPLARQRASTWSAEP